MIQQNIPELLFVVVSGEELAQCFTALSEWLSVSRL